MLCLESERWKVLWSWNTLFCWQHCSWLQNDAGIICKSQRNDRTGFQCQQSKEQKEKQPQAAKVMKVGLKFFSAAMLIPQGAQSSRFTLGILNEFTVQSAYHYRKTASALLIIFQGVYHFCFSHEFCAHEGCRQDMPEEWSPPFARTDLILAAASDLTPDFYFSYQCQWSPWPHLNLPTKCPNEVAISTVSTKQVAGHLYLPWPWSSNNFESLLLKTGFESCLLAMDSSAFSLSPWAAPRRREIQIA